MDVSSVVQFFSQNWETILVTGVFSLITSYFANRRRVSAKQKDRQAALDELRRILEDIIVSNRKVLVSPDPPLTEIGLSSRRIDDLIQAAERKYDVVLSDSTSPAALLQDVDLRLKGSRHLDPEQINQYSECIGTAISELRDEIAQTPRDNQDSLGQEPTVLTDAGGTGADSEGEAGTATFRVATQSSWNIISTAVRIFAFALVILVSARTATLRFSGTLSMMLTVVFIFAISILIYLTIISPQSNS